MPIPRYTPGSGNLGPAQPILDEVGGAWNKGVDAFENPGNAIRGMLGMETPHQQAIDQMNKEANDQTVRDANRTFMPAPVVAPPRRKPMGKM